METKINIGDICRCIVVQLQHAYMYKSMFRISLFGHLNENSDFRPRNSQKYVNNKYGKYEKWLLVYVDRIQLQSIPKGKLAKINSTRAHTESVFRGYLDYL